VNPRFGVREPRVLRSLADEVTPVLPQVRHEGVSLHALRDEADSQPFDLAPHAVDLLRADERELTQGSLQAGSGAREASLLRVDPRDLWDIPDVPLAVAFEDRRYREPPGRDFSSAPLACFRSASGRARSNATHL